MDEARERERQLFHRLSNGKYVTVGSVAESQELRDLERQIQQVELDYVNYAQKHLDFRKDLEEQKASVQETQRLFCLALAGVCVLPLRKGVNTKSVLRMVGLWAGCCFLSKSFRQSCHDMYGHVFGEAMGQMMSNQVRNVKPDSGLGKRKTLFVSGTELPMIPESLAVMKIAFCKQAYVALREPNADRQLILQQYEQACELLYQEGESVGISRVLVDKQMRKIAGDLMDKDASYIGVFEETAYDVLSRGENVRHIQKYSDNGVVKERSYHLWEGSFVDTDGQEFEGAFHPRLPKSVNELRRLSKEAWDRAMSTAMTPEEWGEIVSRADSRQIQQRYLLYIQTDLHLDNNAIRSWDDLSQYMDDNDDVTWMIDMDGVDPFSIGGFDDSLQDMLEHGVTPDSDQLVIGRYPEFKTAYCRWLNHHEDVSPMAMQAKANQCYLEYEAGGKNDKGLLKQVEQYLAQRDNLKDRWNQIYDAITQRVQQLNSANEVRMKELRRVMRPLPSTKDDRSVQR